jgi:predicted GNAT family acetyltransferase
VAGQQAFGCGLVAGEGQPPGGVERNAEYDVSEVVYTPPEIRRRGCAGSATAATVERIYTEGSKIDCLYADLRNPASNRCYAKIGFTPVCKSLHFHRNF